MMGFFGTVGAKLRQRKAAIATVLAFSVIGLGLFLVGTWAGSTGAFTLGTVTASAPPAGDTPGNAPNHEVMCCGKPMPMDKGPDMSMPGGMPMEQMPKDKMGPMPDKKCCEK